MKWLENISHIAIVIICASWYLQSRFLEKRIERFYH